MHLSLKNALSDSDSDLDSDYSFQGKRSFSVQNQNLCFQKEKLQDVGLLTVLFTPLSVSISFSGDSLLHMAAACGREEAGLFLASHGAQPNHTNKSGEMPLHVAGRKGLANLVSELLNK